MIVGKVKLDRLEVNRAATIAAAPITSPINRCLPVVVRSGSTLTTIEIRALRTIVVSKPLQ